MNKKWVTRAGLGVCVALSVAGFGCAKERDPVNRVQANALKKSFFVGENLLSRDDDPEFFYRGTLIDVGYGAGQEGLFTSTYAQPVSRIKWELSEGTLTARLAYERITNSDAKQGTAFGKEGQIVAAFKIQSHFDIRRDYNVSTGEESNVILENTTDRPWYEREYMRIDWSKNLVTDTYDFDTLSMLGVIGGVKYESLSYYVDDPASPDAPVFGDGYFDVTEKAFATPQMITLPAAWGGGTIPSCFLPGDVSGGQAPVASCNPIELKLRLSFRKAVDHDYEPANMDGVRFQAFGAFATDRQGYGRNYGLLDSLTTRFVSRYNLWEKSHYYDGSGQPITCATPESSFAVLGDIHADVHRDSDGNGTEDACEAVTDALGGVPGSRCDEFTKKCTLPYSARETKPLTWYFNYDGKDDYLFDPTKWAAEEWDLALRMAVQTSRYAECMKAGGTATSGKACGEEFPVIKGQQDDYDDAILVVRAVQECRRQNGWDDKANKCAQIADDTAAQLKAPFGDRGAALAKPIAYIAKMPTMLTLCHSPVIKGDHPLCGDEKTKARFGDLRYNVVNVIDAPQSPSPWGIMVDADDPLSGEKLASSINIWNHVTDLASQGAVDSVRYINGELSADDIKSGKYISDWVQSTDGTPGGGPGPSGSSAHTVMPTMSKDEVLHRIAGSANLDFAAVKAAYEAHEAGRPIPAAFALAAKKVESVLSNVQIDPSKSRNSASIEARADAARGSDFEAKLINSAMRDVAALPTSHDSNRIVGSGESDGALDAISTQLASPLRGGNPKYSSAFSQAKQRALAEHGSCLINEVPEFSGIVGLAKRLTDKFQPADGETLEARAGRMRKYIARKFQYGVIVHEMGHSVGLRHNFVSSYDAFTFRPQYWQVRTQNGEITKPCTDAVAGQDAAACVGPRYYDPVTDDENTNMLWMWQQSSVMDYPGDQSVDMLGLGVYDYAATRAFYGDVVSVFDHDDKFTDLDNAQKAHIIDKTDQFGGITGIQLRGPRANAKSLGALNNHYSQIQTNYQVISDCQNVGDDSLVIPADFAGDLADGTPGIDGRYDPVLDSHVVQVKGQWSKCRQRPVDYTFWKSLRMPDDKVYSDEGSGLASYRGGPVADASNRIRVPYAFATDHWADLGNQSVFRHDQGADPYEQFMFFISSSEDRHIFDHYRRKRTTFSVRAAMERDWSRYTEKMMNSAKGLGLLTGIYRQVADADGITFSNFWSFAASSFYSENILAASLAMDHFTRQMTRPQPGPHFFATSHNDKLLRMNDDSYYGSDNKSSGGLAGDTLRVDVVVPEGTSNIVSPTGFTNVTIGAQPINNALDRTVGDYSSQYTYNVGSYYQKIMAVMAMTESQDNFISESRTDFVDARYRATSMADVYPDGFRRLIGTALTNDAELLGPRVVAKDASHVDVTMVTDPATKEKVKYPSHSLGWISFWPREGPSACFSNNGSNVCEKWAGDGASLAPMPDGLNNSFAVDPELGWEVQKFIIAWTYLYLPENQQTRWFDMMRIYRSGDDANPEVDGSLIVWRDPFTGTRYTARGFGRETIRGKEVQVGIAARVLEYANKLTAAAFILDTSGKNAGNVDANKDGIDDVTSEVILAHDAKGAPVINPRSDILFIDSNGCGHAHDEAGHPLGVVNADPEKGTCMPVSGQANTQVGLDGSTPDPNFVIPGWGTCEVSRECGELQSYKSIPDMLFSAGRAYHLTAEHMKGVY